MLRTQESGRTQAEPMLLSLREVATRLCIAVPTLRRWLREEKLAHVRCGRAVRIESAEIRRFIAQNRRPAQGAGLERPVASIAAQDQQETRGHAPNSKGAKVCH